MKKGKLIVIEGIDGVGKNTQALLLKEHIAKTKGSCGFFSFPRYETPTGTLVGAYLRGELGDMTIEQRAKLYADDRLAAKAEIMAFLDTGVDVVCDRYVFSNIAFFSAIAKNAGMSKEQVQALIDYLLEKEFFDNGLPLADALIILSLPEKLSKELVLSKKPREYTEDKLDLHEKQQNIQIYANLYYHEAYPTNLVFCNDGDKIKSIKAIHQLVLQKMESEFKLAEA